MARHLYRAFITYSHADARAAAHLQKALESYRVPPRLAQKLDLPNPRSRRIGKVFRDREELSAGGDLSQSLTASLGNSEYLIVICSPAARASRWVNLEIEEFRKSRGDEKILCYIVAGEPLAEDEADECFPAALGYRPGDAAARAAVEPVAADARPGGDGKRLAKLKLLSGLLNVGLDELIQRDAQRRQRNLAIVTAGSAAGMAAMGILAFVAIDARKAEAARRAEAEDLIEFMLTDLRDRLEDVGRLDVLDAVGGKAIEYYSTVPIDDYPEASLGRRARAFHLLGEVDELKGDLEEARAAFQQAFRSTDELLERAPEDGERIYNHAQSVFWLGYLGWRLGDYDAAGQAFREYVALAEQLVALDPGRVDWVAELGHANINLGVYSFETGAPTEALDYFEAARQVFGRAGSMEPDNLEWPDLVAQSNAWLADVYEASGELPTAAEHRAAEITLYRQILDKDPANRTISSSLLTANRALGRIALSLGDLDAAQSSYAAARNYGDELGRLDPENTLVAQIRAAAYASLGETRGYQGNSEQGLQLLDQADAMVAELLAKDADVLEWLTLKESIRLRRACLLLMDGEVEPVAGLLSPVIARLDAGLEATPDASAIRALLGEAHFYRAEAHARSGSAEKASEAYEDVVRLLAARADALSPHALGLLAIANAELGNPDAARALIGRLETIGFRHPAWVFFSS